MESTRAKKMKYNSTVARVAMELDQEGVLALATIQTALQRASATPTVEVSKSAAVRRAISVYAASLTRITDDAALQREGKRALADTYAIHPHRRRKIIK